jgi:hypothetical protein
MNVTLAPSVKVPAEHMGRARLFRDTIVAEDRASGEAVTAIVTPLRARAERGNAIPRRDALVGAANAWRCMPPRSRLALEVDLQQRRKVLSIREMRLSSSGYLDREWNEAERGLAIILIALDCRPRKIEFSKPVLVHASLHALGRRMERGGDTSDDAIRRDLRLLGEAHRTIADAPNGTAFTVPAPVGSWVGNVALLHTPHGEFDVGLVARTFVAEGGWTRGGI